MQAFTSMMRNLFRWAFFSVAAVVTLWALLPGHRLFLQGMLLGMAGSIVNGAVLLSKTWRVGQAALDPSVRSRGTGMLQRFLVAIFAVYLTVRFPGMFALSGVLIGLFLVPLLSLRFACRSFK